MPPKADRPTPASDARGERLGQYKHLHNNTHIYIYVYIYIYIYRCSARASFACGTHVRTRVRTYARRHVHSHTRVPAAYARVQTPALEITWLFPGCRSAEDGHRSFRLLFWIARSSKMPGGQKSLFGACWSLAKDPR